MWIFWHDISQLELFSGHVALIETNSDRVLTVKPEGSRQLGRCRCRWEDSIDMDLTQVGYEGVDWILLNEPH